MIGRQLALSAFCVFPLQCLSDSNLRLIVLTDDHQLPLAELDSRLCKLFKFNVASSPQGPRGV